MLPMHLVNTQKIAVGFVFFSPFRVLIISCKLPAVNEYAKKKNKNLFTLSVIFIEDFPSLCAAKCLPYWKSVTQKIAFGCYQILFLLFLSQPSVLQLGTVGSPGSSILDGGDFFLLRDISLRGPQIEMYVYNISSKTSWITALNIPVVFQKHLREDINLKSLKIKMYIPSQRSTYEDGGWGGWR